MTYLNCGKNLILDIDVSNNTSLVEFECYYNQLTILNVSQNTALTKLLCHVNHLTYLDVRNGHNSYLTTFNAINNDLTCINVDEEAADHSSWNVGPNVDFSNDCSNNTQRGEDVAVLPIDADTETTPIEVTFENVRSAKSARAVVPLATGVIDVKNAPFAV